MRKLHLLQAEWRYDQRLADTRAYLMMRVHLTDPPAAGDIFPTMADVPNSVDQAENPDDHVMFSQAAAMMGAH